MLGSRFDLTATVVEIAQREALAARAVVAECDLVLGDHCVEIERQMAEVARRLHSASPRTSVSCPVCDSRMQFSAEQVSLEDELLDVKRHHLECDTCGMTTVRAFDASHGYQRSAFR